MVKIPYPIELVREKFKERLAVTPDPLLAFDQAFQIIGNEYLLKVDQVVFTGLPLGSMTASGKFRDKVFATRNGKTHVRKLTIPNDPKTVPQIEHRTKFGDAAKSWAQLPQSVKDEYNRRADGKPYSGMNIYMSEQF